jgi:anion-transporting  ArsA/GET3 family ATPase
LIAGCSTNPVEQKQETAENLIEMKQTVAETRAQVDKTLGSLNTLMVAPAPQLAQAYSTYAKDVEKLSDNVKEVKEQSREVNESSGKWVAAWQNSYDEVQDVQLKSLSEERRQQLIASLDRINTSSRLTRDALEPLIRNLQDVKTVLGNDLTPRGIDQVASTDIVQRANENGQVATRQMDVAISDYQLLANRLAANQ